VQDTIALFSNTSIYNNTGTASGGAFYVGTGDMSARDSFVTVTDGSSIINSSSLDGSGVVLRIP
jgi:hypothetical protein